MNPFDLSNKVICVTGASSGIGRQCAVSCSRMGATVVLLARNEQRLHETLSIMDNPDKHVIIPVDLTEYATVELVVKNIVSQVSMVSSETPRIWAYRYGWYSTVLVKYCCTSSGRVSVLTSAASYSWPYSSLAS